jgi:hypothetical protein
MVGAAKLVPIEFHALRQRDRAGGRLVEKWTAKSTVLRDDDRPARARIATHSQQSLARRAGATCQRLYFARSRSG